MEKNYFSKENFGLKFKQAIVILLFSILSITIGNAQVTAVDDGGVTIAEGSVYVSTTSVLANDTNANSVPAAIASAGVITMNTNGSYVFDATGVPAGTVTIDYLAQNTTTNEFDTATLTITVVTGIIANDDSYSINHTNSNPEIYLGNILTNDSSPTPRSITEFDGTPLTPVDFPYTLGGLTIDASGNLTYAGTGLVNPLSISYDYELTNGSNTDTATITLIRSNQVPVTSNDGPYEIAAGATLSVPSLSGLLSNDSDADSDTFTINSNTSPPGGTLNVSPDGSFTYVAPGTTGSQNFTYNVTDGGSTSNTSSVFINVVNLAANDVFSISHGIPNGTVIGNILDNDDPGPSITLEDVEGVSPTYNGSFATGTFSVDSSGNITINTNQTIYSGAPISFDYIISDTSGPTTVTQTATAVINLVNSAPIANDDPLLYVDDSVTAVNVLSNDSDPDGDTFTLEPIVTTTAGSASVSGSDIIFDSSGVAPGTIVTVTYEITDGDLTDTASFEVIVDIPAVDKVIQTEISSCNVGTIPASVEFPNGLYKIQYTGSISNPSYEEDMTGIQLVMDLESIFGSSNAIVGIEVTEMTTSHGDGPGTPWFHGSTNLDWDTSSIDVTSPGGFIPQNNYLQITEGGLLITDNNTAGYLGGIFNTNADLGGSGGAFENNILRSRQQIDFSFCIYVDPIEADDGDGAGEGVTASANSGDVNFDTIITASSTSHGSDTANVLIQDFHTSDANVAAKMFIPVTSPPVNSDGTYDFSIYVTLTNDSDQPQGESAVAPIVTATSGALATNVQYYLPWEQFIHSGVTDPNLINTSVVNFVSGYSPILGQLNTSYNGDGAQKGLLIPGTTLPAGETVVLRVDYNVGPTQDLGVSRTFETIGTAMSKGAADGLDEGDPTTPNALTYVEWEDSKGVHVDRYYNGDANSITNPPTNVPASQDQCLCDEQSMSFDYGVYLTLEKSTLSDVPAASGTPDNRDVLFQLVLENLIFSTVEVDNLRVQDAISDICGAANVVSVGTPQIVSSSATQNPNINLNYNGLDPAVTLNASDDINIFDGTSGVLEPGQQIIVTILVEMVTPCPGDNAATFDADDPNGIVLAAAASSTKVNNPPVAIDDSISGIATGSQAIQPVLANGPGTDYDPDDSLVASTLQIVGTAAPGDPLVVPGEGTWTIINVSGETADMVFTPGTYTFQGNTIPFTGDPTPITYTVEDTEGNVSNVATVSAFYVAEPPVAFDDLSDNTGAGHPPGPVNVDPFIDNGGFGVDADTDGALDPTSVNLVIPTGPVVTGVSIDGDGDVIGFTVQGEGSWSVNPLSGLVSFVPVSGFTNNPTPIDYNIRDNDGNISTNPGPDDFATITIDYAPIATDDESLGNTTLLDVTLNVTANDTDGDAVVPATVSIITAGATDTDGDPNGTLDELVVPGEGTWTVNNTTGEITFSPCTVVALPDCPAIFTGNPTDIDYEVADAEGHVVNASVNIEYAATPPVAVDDSSTGNTTLTAVSVEVFGPTPGNDNDPDGTLDPATLQITGTALPGDPLIVVGEGTWSITTGPGAEEASITFTPCTVIGPNCPAIFTGNPTPITYTVNDNDGNTSNVATVTIEYDPQPPTAEDDTSIGNTIYSPVTIDPFVDNGSGVDADPDGTLDPSTVSLVVPTTGNVPNPGTIITDGNGDVTYFEISGEGSWQVDGTTGAITFTPEPGFISSPTPVEYNVEDNDSNVSNDALVTIEYIPQADVQITKTDNSDDYIPGTTVTYTITVTNNGPAEATGVAMEDDLSAITGATVTWTSDLPSSGSGSVISDTIGNLAVASEVVYTVIVEVPSNFTGTIVNVATVTSTSADPNLTNNIAEDSNNPLPQAALVVTKAIDNATPNVGSDVAFTITVTNNGPSDASGIDLVDNLPSGYEYVSSSTTSGTYDEPTGLWNGFDLANGAVETMIVTATVQADGNYTNVAEVVKADQADPNSTHGNGDPAEDDQAEVTGVVPNAIIDLETTITVDNANPNTGDTVTFTVTVVNNGPSDATGVVVTDDILGANFSLVGASPSGGTTNTYSGSTWTIGSLGANDSATLIITAEVTADGNVPLTAIPVTAEVTAANEDDVDSDPTILASITNEDDDDTVSITVSASDLVTVKSVDDNNPNEGDTIVYTLVVENNGPSDATGVSLTDNLPAGVTYSGNTVTSGSYNPATELWTIGDLTSGSIATLTISATVDVGMAGSTVTNTATAAVGDQTDPTTVSDTLDAPITVSNDTDILLVKVVDNDTPNTGDTITYTITVTNNGPAEATNLVVEDQIPSGIVAGLVTPSSGIWSAPNWTIGTLASGATETLTIEAEVTALGTIPQVGLVNVVSNTQDQDDDNSTPDTPTATVTVTAADLVTTKVVDNNSPTEGELITYTITVENYGPSDATNIILTDNLPFGVTYDSYTVTDGAFSSGDNDWEIANLANGATATLTISAIVDAGTASSTITNAILAAIGDQSDPTSVSDTLDAPITVTNTTDIVLTKVVDNDTPNTGDLITYTITVTNAGPAQVTNLVVEDVLPVGIEEGLVTPSTGTWASPYWIIGTLASGLTETLTIVATVSATGMIPQVGLVNLASNTQDQIDSNLTPDDPIATVTVTAANLVTEKAVNDSVPLEGDTITYTIVVTNNGPSDATGVSLNDLLPTGVTHIGDDAGGDYNQGDGNWIIGDLTSNETVTLTISATVNSGTAGQSITNTTTAATGDQTDPTTVSDTLEAVILVSSFTDIVVTKEVDNPTPNTGDLITFTITVKNEGPAEVTGLELEDQLPIGMTEGLVTPSAGSWASPIWTIGTLPAGITETLTIEAVVTASGTIPQIGIVNTVSHTQDQIDSNLLPDDLSETVTVTASDLLTVKSVSNPIPYEGETINYTIAVTNNGPSDATGIELNDLLPAGVTYSGDDSGGLYNPGDGDWIVGDILSGNTVTLTISATVDVGTAGQTVTNTTTAAIGDQTDPLTVSDTLDASITVQNFADVQVNKIVDNNTPNTGDTITFTITVTNHGPTVVTNVVIEDQMPPEFTIGNVLPTTGIFDGQYWDIGTLASGTTETLQIEALVTASGTIPQVGLVNIVSNTQDQIDLNIEPDDLTETVTITASDLQTNKDVSDSNPAEGDLIDYTIVVTNNGPSPATSVTLTDLLPIGVTYVADNIGANYNDGSGIWTIGDLADGETVTLTISATVDVGTASTTITNYTTAATGDQTDPINDDVLQASITVQNLSDIVLTKIVDNETPNTGDTVTFTITVTNAGQAEVSNLVIEDVLPIGLTEGIVTPSYGTWASPYWTIGTLASGTTETLTIEALVAADGEIPQVGLMNTVSNTQDQVDSNLTPDDPTATVTVTASDIETIKTVSDANPAESDVITYTLAVTNNGPSPATNVSLIDKLPLGVSYVSDDGLGAYTWGDGDWTIGDLAIGETVTLTISATVDVGTASSTITNSTTAALGDQTDPISDDVLQATITVQNFTDIILTKVVDNETPDTGDIVTYTITVTNAGPALVTGLVVEDVLPVGVVEVANSAIPTTGVWTAPYWTIGELATDATETLVIQALVEADGTVAQIPIVNIASHTQDQIDSSLPSTASASITVTASELVTTKTVTNTSPGKMVYEEGDTILYTITVENQGPSPATNVSLIDKLPLGVSYVSDDGLGAYTWGDGDWTIGDLATNTTVTLSILATVDALTASSTITNFTTAAVGDQTDPDLVSDTLEASIFVENYSDIVITKAVNDETPNTGDIITYTITITNNGPAVVTNLEVEDILPPFEILEVATMTTPSAGLWNAPVWSIGTLGVGRTETLTIDAYVKAPGTLAQLPITNTASHTQDQYDSSPPSEASVDVIVTAADLVTVKTVSDPNPQEGDIIIYTIEVTNNGPSGATGVYLTDILPAGVTYISHEHNLVSGDYNHGSGIWKVYEDLEYGGGAGLVATLYITAQVDVGTAGTSITNYTTAAEGDQTDPTTVGDILEATIDVQNYSDIVLTKVVDNPTPNTGDTVTYTITVKNNGPAAVTNLVIDDTLPEGLTFGIVNPSDGTWTAPNWFVDKLEAGEEETLVIEALVIAEGTMEQIPLTNVVSNTQDQDDSNLTEDDLEEDIIITASDLETTKTVSNETPAEGELITYTIEVTNNGPSSATGVSLVDLLPIGVTYVSDNTDGAYNSGDGNWTIGEIASDETVTLEIMATVDEETAGLTVTNTTTAATGDQTDPIQEDDLDATIIVQNLADLVISKIVDNNTPNAGDVVTYTITITNNGPADATNVVVTDMLPEGLTYGSIISPSIGNWTAPNWTIGTLASGDAETIVIEAIVGMDQGGMTLTNTVSNTQDQEDSNLTNDDASETIIVTSSDLATVKTVSNETPNEGTIITYTIAITNNGPSTATNVSLVDNLPVGVTYVSHSTANGVFNFGSGEWNIGEIANGATVTLEIQAMVDYETVGQTITNTTSAVTADQSDSDDTNNVGSVSIIPTAYIDLSLTKVVVGDLEDLEVGDMVTFEIRVANEGPTEATGVQVTDMIPSGYAYFGVYSSSIGTYDKDTGIWNIGFIEIGNTAVLLVDVMVLDTGDYMNCAEITAANETDVDSTPNNGDATEDDYACASAPPVQSLDLKIEKSVIADNLTPMVGDEVSFEIRLINDGDIEGTDVIVTDLLPSGYTYLNYSSSRGTYDDDSGIWNVGTIVDGDTEILIVDAIVNATGDYLNCASITAMHQIDSDLSNNSSCIATDPIKVIDLELTKDVDMYEPYAETNVDFTINLTNNGPSDATGVQVKDLLPSGYTFVSATTTVGTYDEGTGIWNVGNVLLDETETLVITAYVLPIGEWTNVAEVIAANELDLDSTPGNNDIYEDDQDEQKTEPIVLLTIAEGFSPNGDGINDVFEIEFLEVLYPNFSMEIVDRYGNIVYTYKHNGDPYTTPRWWDGFSNGRMNFSSEILPAGTYFYTIYFNNDDRGPKTGWVYLRK